MTMMLMRTTACHTRAIITAYRLITATIIHYLLYTRTISTHTPTTERDRIIPSTQTPYSYLQGPKVWIWEASYRSLQKSIRS